jgi:hypothetical protein
MMPSLVTGIVRKVHSTKTMTGYGFLIFSLVVAAVLIGGYYFGPVAKRWGERFEKDLERMRRGE